MSWQNRTVRIGDAELDRLVANPLNWRIHPAYQHQSLDAVLTRVGWVRRVIISAATDRIIDGHLRVVRAKARGDTTIPARWVDVSEQEEATLLYAFDQIAGLSLKDAEKADALARKVLADEANAEGALGLLLNGLLQKDTAPPGVFDGKELKGLAKRSQVRIRMGVYYFDVPQGLYDAWLEMMKEEYGDDPYSVALGALDRLGLGVV